MENIELISELITGRVKPHIYAFTTNTIPNYLKVGDTYRALTVRLNEWRKHFPNLQQVYSNPASIDDEIFFRDYAVHDFLIHEKGKYRLLRWNLSRGFSAKHNVSENSVQNICRAVSPQRMRIIGSMVFFYL